MLRAEPGVFGPVASDPTVSRLIDTLAAAGDKALTAIRAARAEVRDRVWKLAGEAAPGSAPLPADAHQTVVAVAALLAEQHEGAVTLNTRHAEGGYDPETDEGFGCGCDVTILGDDEEYNFHRGDSEWSVTRESDGRELSDDSVIFHTWKTLSTTLETAHPQQLVDDVLRVMVTEG